MAIATLEEYLREFSVEIGDRILTSFPALHAPGDPVSPILGKLLRKPFAAQAVAISGAAKRLQQSNSVGVVVVADVTAADQYSVPTSVSWGSVELSQGGSPALYYTDFVSGTGAFNFGSSSCGPWSETPGIYSAVRCKFSPIIYSVGPLITGPARVVQAGGTITISGTGFRTQCSTCSVTAANPNVTTLQVLSWNDGLINVTLPATFGIGIATIAVSASTGTDAINIYAMTVSQPCSFTLALGSLTLSQIGTASSGGALPENPTTIGITPSHGAVCSGNFTATSSASWLNAIGSTSSFSFTALTNPHPTARSANITLGNTNGGSAVFTVTEAGDPEPLNNRQVRALYQSVLGRDPDSGGFAFWTAQGSVGLGQMLDLFLTSPEAFNSDFVVMATFQAATGGPPTYAQFTSAVAGIRAGTSIASLFSSLIPSGYTVLNLYQNLLNRAPLSSEVNSANAAGLGVWFETLIGYPSVTSPVTAQNNEFMSTGTFEAGPDHSNGLYITMLYYVILGRDIDPGGYAFWLGIANAGGSGILFQGAIGQSARLQVLGLGSAGEGFAGSPEFQGLYQ